MAKQRRKKARVSRKGLQGGGGGGDEGRLMEGIQKDPAAQHNPGSVFHAGKSNIFSDEKQAYFS